MDYDIFIIRCSPVLKLRGEIFLLFYMQIRQ